MQDIAISWNIDQGAGDWSVSNGDLSQAPPIVSAIYVMIFSDHVASPGYVPTDRSGSLRGWWADAFRPYPIGSGLWQLYRAKKTDRTTIPNIARGMVISATAPLIQQKVAASIDVATGWISRTALGIAVQVAEPNGSSTRIQFAWAWQGV